MGKGFDPNKFDPQVWATANLQDCGEPTLANGRISDGYGDTIELVDVASLEAGEPLIVRSDRSVSVNALGRLGLALVNTRLLPKQ